MTQLPFDPRRRARKDSAWTLALAWAIITALTAVLFVSNNWPGASPAPKAHDMNAQSELPGKVALAVAHWVPQYGSMMLGQVDELRKGSIPEKLAFAVLAGELDGPQRAAEELEAIEIPSEPDLVDGVHPDELQSGTDKGSSQVEAVEPGESGGLMKAREALLRIMELRQGAPPQGVDVIAALDSGQVDAIKQELGWYGELALLPTETTNVAARETLVRASTRLLLVLGVYGLWFLAAALAGAVVLIVLLVQAWIGETRSRLSMDCTRHGLYAEMFALWMVLFLLLQLGVEAMRPPDHLRLGLSGALIVATLLVLGWPVLRGATWQQVKDDLGLHLGRGLLVEIGCGMLVYCMGLAMLVGGLIVSAALMYLQQMMRPGAPPPSHPVVDALAGGGVWTFVQVIALGVIVAPIVEETMFRGALYGQLRRGLGFAGTVLAIVISALVSSFIFAAIHPQGWTLVPALMGLAIGFCIGREWRGCLLPCMVAHGGHNLLTLLIGFLVFN